MSRKRYPEEFKIEAVKQVTEAAFFASMQRQERLKGGPISRRSSDTHRLIRYQRNGIARLSRAVRQG